MRAQAGFDEIRRGGADGKRRRERRNRPHAGRPLEGRAPAQPGKVARVDAFSPARMS